MQLLRVKIAQGELRPDFAGAGRHDFFQFVQPRRSHNPPL